MKKIVTFVLALLMLTSLTACGSTPKESKSVDLKGFYSRLAKEYKWDKGDMVGLTDALLDNYYPGLKKLSAKQLVAEVPQMSSKVNELAFVECKSEADAKKAQRIFQKRIDDQTAGGAMYPETMAAWKKAKVRMNGCYVAMIASADHQSAIEKEFMELFA